MGSKAGELLVAFQQLLHIGGRQARVLQNFLGARPLEVLYIGPKDQLVLVFAGQALLLNQLPAGFIHKKVERMIE